MCSPKVFPIAPHFNPIYFAQSPPLKKLYYGWAKGELTLPFHRIFCCGEPPWFQLIFARSMFVSTLVMLLPSGFFFFGSLCTLVIKVNCFSTSYRAFCIYVFSQVSHLLGLVNFASKSNFAISR